MTCAAMIEEDIRVALPGTQTTIHVEPREDYASFDGGRSAGIATIMQVQKSKSKKGRLRCAPAVGDLNVEVLGGVDLPCRRFGRGVLDHGGSDREDGQGRGKCGFRFQAGIPQRQDQLSRREAEVFFSKILFLSDELFMPGGERFWIALSAA